VVFDMDGLLFDTETLTELCAIGSRVQTIGHTLPIGIARVSLNAVLPSHVSIKPERRPRIEVRRILIKMLAQQFTPKRTDDCGVPD
jgi:hypothetical protein